MMTYGVARHKVQRTPPALLPRRTLRIKPVLRTAGAMPYATPHAAPYRCYDTFLIVFPFHFLK